MIIGKLEFLELAQLDRETLEVWLAEEWLFPTSKSATGWCFPRWTSARVRLIRDLTQNHGRQ